MALRTAPPPIVALRGSSEPLRGRGHPEYIVLRATDALAPCTEGVALADEVVAHVDRILLAAAAGSRHAVSNEAARLGYRAGRYRDEFRRMAAGIEPPDDAA